uniref:rRNA 2-O-methyltransferase fibrillarin n=1 Tax=Caligus rogercresseyi TaxID=217165 RepID=C1BQV2_CALRO|nr:rRNA 2-O-methyltransferase fibrillarin [Caligus rogercresseyi]
MEYAVEFSHRYYIVPGKTVYGEMHISVDQGGAAGNIEYNVWNPFRSKWAVCVYYSHVTWL